MAHSDRYLQATPTTAATQSPLTTEQARSWQEQGVALVSGLFDPALIDRVAQFADTQFPAPNSPEAAGIRQFGSEGHVNFPSTNAAFNELTLHPRLLQSMAQLLRCSVRELRLTQADLWAKYGHSADATTAVQDSEFKASQDNSDQRIHVDYPNHTLVHPTPWHRPEAVELIVYFDDHASCHGATAVVPRDGDDDPAYRWPIVDTPGVGELHYVNDKQSAEAYMARERPAAATWRQSLYQRERYARFQRGDVLLYRHDTWHRGTPMLQGRRRLVLNVTYRHARAEWINTLHIGWAWAGYQPGKEFMRLLAQATLEQRAVLGFPQPGDSYWCPQTIEAVQARYAAFGMDMQPYIDALPADSTHA